MDTFRMEEGKMIGVERGIGEMSLECWQSSLFNHRCLSEIIQRTINLFFALLCVIVKPIFKNKKIRKNIGTSIRMRI